MALGLDRAMNGSAQGSTAVHLLFFVGVLAVAWALLLTTVGTAMFQPSSAASPRPPGQGAAERLEEAVALFTRDVERAEATDLTSGAPSASNINLWWTGGGILASVPAVAGYALDGGNLVRTYNGTDELVAQDVVSVAFSLDGDEVTAVFALELMPGLTEPVTVTGLLNR